MSFLLIYTIQCFQWNFTNGNILLLKILSLTGDKIFNIKILLQITKCAISHDTRIKYRYRTVTVLPRDCGVRRNYMVAVQKVYIIVQCINTVHVLHTVYCILIVPINPPLPHTIGLVIGLSTIPFRDWVNCDNGVEGEIRSDAFVQDTVRYQT